MTFIMSHYENFAHKIKSKLSISFQIDSSCLGSWLSSHMVHKNVFVRNACTKIHDLCIDISRDYKLEINFIHVAGTGNIADCNPKIVDGADPIALTNSDEWRHGNPTFYLPGEDMIFLKYVDGEMK